MNPNPKFTIVEGPDRYWLVPAIKGGKPQPWRRLTLKTTAHATARTVNRNLRRIALAQSMGLSGYLRHPAAQTQPTPQH